jgi:hypothetical protein
MSDPAAKVVTGVVRGQTIVLDEDPGWPDGTRVLITVVPVVNSEISDEDRAILEHVYRERGCGVETDC